MIRKLHTLEDVIAWNMCVGCGACAALCSMPEGVLLEDMPEIGIRPVLPSSGCGECRDCLEFCPGYRLEAGVNQGGRSSGLNKNHLIGDYYRIFAGYSANEEIRYQCASGGILTSLACYCLEELGMKQVIHVAMDPEQPWKNRTVVSTTREEILERSGSRYCTSSPCEFLDIIEAGDGLSVFIGKPCDVAALSQARRKRPELDAKVGLALSFFCAGTPSSEGVVSYAEKLGADRAHIREVRFRGEGWPGQFRVEVNGPAEDDTVESFQDGNEGGRHFTESYMNSWQVLAKHRPFRCHICPDGLGQFADIVAGDAWNQYRHDVENNGLSHVIVRTARGSEVLAEAGKAGRLELQQATVEEVVAGQGLVVRRVVSFGRIIGARLAGMPVTKFSGFNLFRVWVRTNPLVMLKSILDTVRRIVKRKLFLKKSLVIPESKIKN